MQTPLLQYAGPVVQADTAATPNTVPMRDNSGNLVAVQMNGSELKSTGTLTLPAPPTKTTSFTADGTVVSYVIDATSGAVTATLEPAATCPGRVHEFKKKDSSANAMIVKGSGSENVDGANTNSTTTQYAVIRVKSDGTQWWVF